MVGNVALLLGYHDSNGVPGHEDRWPAQRVWWGCPSPWLPEATFASPGGHNARYYFAPIEDAL